MGVSNLILFDGKNTYEIGANASLWSFPAVVSGEAHVTLQFMIRAKTSDTSLTLDVIWLGIKGFRVEKETQVYTAKTGAPQIHVLTLPVPIGAAKVMICAKAGGGAVYFGKAKLEKGQIPTAFDSIDINRVSKLDAHGLYTGTVWANQVIVTSGETAAQAITSIRAGAITLQNGVSSAQSTANAANGKADANATSITQIISGAISLQTIGGFAVDSNRLRKTTASNFINLNSSGTTNYIECGIIASNHPNIKFKVTKNGDVECLGNLNVAGQLVYTASNQTLTLSGIHKTLGSNNKLALQMDSNNLTFYDWQGSSAAIGAFSAGRWVSGSPGTISNTAVVSFSHNSGYSFTIGYQSGSVFKTYVVFDKQARIASGYPIYFTENAWFNNKVQVGTEGLFVSYSGVNYNVGQKLRALLNAAANAGWGML